MKKILQSLALAATLSTGTAAQAVTFDFSYTFENGTVANGSFDGVANGDIVTDLTNVQVAINGKPFEPWNPPQAFGLSGAAAVASFDGLENNFSFMADSFVPGQYFTYKTNGFNSSASVSAYNWETGDSAQDNYADMTAATAHWSLKAVSAVPELGTYAMLLVGLTIIGFAARRGRHA